MIKSSIKIGVVACLVVSLLTVMVIGCSPAPTTVPTTAPKPAAEKVFIRVDGGPAAGSSKYFKQELLAQVLRKGNPTWNVQLLTGPSAVSLYGMMLQKNVDFMYLMSTLLLEARGGMLMGDKMPAPLEVRWIIPAAIQYQHLFAAAEVPINGYADWISRKVPLNVGIGSIGTEPWYNSLQTLEAYGATQKQMEGWGCKFYPGNSVENGRLMGDGITQVFVQSNSLPQGDMQQVSVTKQLKLFGIPEPEIRAKMKKIGWTDGIIPAKTFYTFQDKDIQTVSILFFEIVRADMSDDIAYNITRAINENRDFLYSGQIAFKEVLTDDVIKSSYNDFKEWIHPGAKKYYVEKGLVK